MLLPLLSLIATIATALSFLWPLFRTCTTDVAGSASCELATTDYVVLGVMYVALAFITIFFNAALIHAANERMDGGDPTVGSALRGAALRVHRILPWAIVSATVSIILRAIEERAGAVGRIVSAIAGVAWALVTFLVIPVMVIEDVGVKEAVKRSGAMFRRTWGENVAAQVGFGLLGLLLTLPAMLAIGLGAAAGGAIAVILIGSAVGWMLVVALVIATLSGIFQTALYRYASGKPTDAFPTATLEAAFAPKQGGRSGGMMPRGFGG